MSDIAFSNMQLVTQLRHLGEVHLTDFPDLFAAWSDCLREVNLEQTYFYKNHEAQEFALKTIAQQGDESVTHFLIDLYRLSKGEEHKILGFLKGRRLPEKFSLDLLDYQSKLRTVYDQGGWETHRDYYTERLEFVAESFSYLEPSADKYIIEYLVSASKQDVRDAVGALGRIRTQAANDHLMKMFENLVTREGSDMEKAYLIDDVIRAIGLCGAHSASKRLILYLHNPNPEIRCYVGGAHFSTIVSALAKIGSSDAIEELRLLLADSDQDRRMVTAARVGASRNYTLVDPLIRTLSTLSPSGIIDATKSLVLFGDKKSKAALRKLLSHQDGGVRYAANKALATFGEKHRVKFELGESLECTICARAISSAAKVKWIENDYLIDLAKTGWKPSRLAPIYRWYSHADSCPFDYWVVCEACLMDYLRSGGRTDEK